MGMKIKSKTDVITNSSTEVYTYWDNDAPKIIEKYLKNIVKALTGQSIKVSDCFEIRLKPGWWLEEKYSDLYEEGKLDKNKYPAKPEWEDYYRFADEYSKYLDEKNEEYDFPSEWWDGIDIKAKKPEYKTAAKNLSELIFGGLFTQEAYYG